MSKSQKAIKNRSWGFQKGHVPWTTGRTHSKETILKMSDIKKGKVHSDETKEKISESKKEWFKTHDHPMLDKKHSPETIAKMIESQNNRSDETREKMGRAARGRTGERASNWQGGKTPKNHLIRWSSEMKAWRNFVFERDDYQCQECLKWGGELNAHHCKSFAEYPHLRFQTWNGLTLCKECHMNYHWGD